MSEIILKHGGGQNFSFGQQHDSHEFCMALLDKLSSQDTRGCNAEINPKNSKESHNTSVLKQPFNRWFAYNVASDRVCLKCNNIKTEVQPSRELKIELSDNSCSRTSSSDSNLIRKSVRSSSRHSKKKRYTDEGISFLDKELAKFEDYKYLNGIPDSPAASGTSSTSGTPVTINTQEMIDSCLDDKFGIDWTCDRCDHFNESSIRKMRITSLPVVLVVILQRFMFDSKTCNLQKLNNNIKIDHEISVDKLLGSSDRKLDQTAMPLNEVKQKYCRDYTGGSDTGLKNGYPTECDQLDTDYKLMAVVDHIGANAADGHYTATCLEPKQTLLNHTPGIESELQVDQDNLVWTEYDDLIVKPYRQNAKSFPDESTSAYMLFYLNKGVTTGVES